MASVMLYCNPMYEWKLRVVERGATVREGAAIAKIRGVVRPAGELDADLQTSTRIGCWVVAAFTRIFRCVVSPVPRDSPVKTPRLLPFLTGFCDCH